MKEVILAALFLFFSCSLFAQNAEQVLLKAKAANAQAKLSSAQTLLQSLSEEDWQQEHHELALEVLFRQEKYQEVIDYGEVLFEHMDLSLESQLLLLHASLDVGAMKNAYDLLQTIEFELRPDQYQIVQGRMRMMNSAFTEAENHFKAALALNPESSSAWLFYGNLMGQQKKLDKAIEAYKMAQKLSPNDVRAFRELGDLYTQESRVIEALKQYAKGIKLNPEAISLLMGGAELALEDGQFSLARYFSNKAIDVNESLAQAHSISGMSYYFQNNYENAIPHLTNATRYRNDGEDHYYLGLSAFETKQTYQALTHLQMAKNLGLEEENLPQMVEQCRSVLASSEEIGGKKSN